MQAYVVTPQILSTQLNQQDLLLIDTRPLSEYQQAHIPHAVHFDIQHASRSMAPVSGLLPSPEFFSQQLTAIGVDSQKQLIIYDNNGGPSAGRLVWTLATYGHPNAVMLDGGMYTWLAEGYPVDRRTVHTKPGKFYSTYIPDYVADRHEILSKLQKPDILILDTRSAEEFSGKIARSTRGGHIPGAVNLDWNETKNPDMHMQFKAPATLNKMLTNRGITPDKEIITYCQSHQRSALMWVLLRNLGYQNVKGYPGAWSDWGNRNDTPVESL